MVIDLWRAVDRLAVVVPRRCYEAPTRRQNTRDLLEGRGLVGAKRRESMPKTPRAEPASSGMDS